MATPPIERKNGRYFRKYPFQATDSLVAVCLSFGQPDWPTIYGLPENKEFRFRHPKKEGSLQGTAPVDLYLPLPEGSSTGLSLNGSASDSYILAIVRDKDGVPLDDLDLWLVPPETSKDPEFRTKTNKSGIFFMPNPQKRIYEITTPYFELEDSEEPAAEFEVAKLDLSIHANRPTALFPLRPDSPAEIRARRSFYVTCPMCGVDFKIVESMPQHSPYRCPNDKFDFSSIEKAILNEESSFLDPEKNKQDPIQNPLGLKCRGTCPANLGPYEILRYWDESRFVDPEGQDYTLSGLPEAGERVSVEIRSRKEWKAASVKSGKGRIYRFHGREMTGKYPYTFPIGSNETNPLTDCLWWATIHHTGAESSGFPEDQIKSIQTEHQTKGAAGGGGPMADIAYHYAISADGEVFEARVLGIIGSHAELFNPGNVGIILLGNYEVFKPGDSAIESLKLLLRVLVSRFTVWSARPHKERKEKLQLGTTACPGKHLIKIVVGDEFQRSLGFSKLPGSLE